MIERKSEGQEIKRPAPVAGKVTDLMEALRASVEAARREKAGGTPGASESAAEDAEMAAKPARRRRAG